MYYRHHIFFNNSKILRIDSKNQKFAPSSTVQLLCIEEKDTQEIYTIPISSFYYIKTEAIGQFAEESRIDNLKKQDPYNGIVPEVKDQMDKSS